MDEFIISINEIPTTLGRFISTRKINREEVEKTFKAAISKITEKQVRVLSDGRLSLESQRVIFGALRTLRTVIDSMYIALLSAEARGENPTTAEKCNEVISLVVDVANQVSEFNPYEDSDDGKLELLFAFSRNLRKKASNTGFSKSIDEELKEISMSPDDINKFAGSLTQTIQNRLDLDF